MDKKINGRLINKHDTEANWLKATGFIPLKAETIIYDKDENYSYERIKIGDGEKTVNELPFIYDNIISKMEELESDIADLKYIPIQISSFTHNKGIVEIGTIIADITLSWSINKTPITLTLDGSTIDTSIKNKSITGLSITHNNNKTWKLVATDERGETSEKTTSINFYNGVYYGASEEPSSYDSEFILSLTKTLRNNKLSTFTADANNENSYIYYCIPTRFGTCEFTVGGFTGGFSLIDTIQFTNNSGYTESYYVYRSDETNLGKTDVNVK